MHDCAHDGHDHQEQEEVEIGSSRAYFQCRHFCNNCGSAWECVVGECLFLWQKLALCGTCYLSREVIN